VRGREREQGIVARGRGRGRGRRDESAQNNVTSYRDASLRMSAPHSPRHPA
jgi:hypothetical protein